MFDIKSEPTALESIMLGATARSISGVTMIPFTVIKTRFEVSTFIPHPPPDLSYLKM